MTIDYYKIATGIVAAHAARVRDPLRADLELARAKLAEAEHRADLACAHVAQCAANVADLERQLGRRVGDGR